MIPLDHYKQFENLPLFNRLVAATRVRLCRERWFALLAQEQLTDLLLDLDDDEIGDMAADEFCTLFPILRAAGVPFTTLFIRAAKAAFVRRIDETHGDEMAKAIWILTRIAEC